MGASKLSLLLIPAAFAAAYVATGNPPAVQPAATDYVLRTSTSTEVGSSRANSITGRASVIDGDTIEIAGQRVRLNGIDAPESTQNCNDASGRSYACGRQSANALSEFLAASRPVTCEFVEWDQYGRFVGNCTRADGSSVQEWLVRNGHALDWPRYSNGAFSGHEKSAKASKLGVWQGEFQKPWEWRAAQRESSAAAVAGPVTSNAGRSACNIKGNISKKGERIYHVPGQKYYSETRITESKGERWFCSENEAQQAGWRRSRT
jgi:endonuclease YncB( thermonuclease family)